MNLNEFENEFEFGWILIFVVCMVCIVYVVFGVVRFGCLQILDTFSISLLLASTKAS